jgi:hypothetical protein
MKRLKYIAYLIEFYLNPVALKLAVLSLAATVNKRVEGWS